MTRLGIRENLPQFALLVLVNAFVGAMVGMERTVLPLMGEAEFGLAARTAVLSFIAAFGLAKAATNWFAGSLADRAGRKKVLVAGWLVGLPVPFLLMWAPTWDVVIFANVLLGVSQGLAWSATVIMKIDLAGPQQRGLAMGLNEFAGYLAVAGSALATGWVASVHGLRPAPFVLGVGYALLGLAASVWLVRETAGHVAVESRALPTESLSTADVFRRATLTDPTLSSASQAGLVNNLNDGMAWGLFPLLYVAADLPLAEVSILVAIYPAVWGLGQLVTGPMSDRWGRRGLIASGMAVQALGLALVVPAESFSAFAGAAVLQGMGTAMVYPTLLAAVGDAAHPSWRASAVGVYRLWRDSGYVVGAVLAGVVADALGAPAAIALVAAVTAGSGVLVAVRMPKVTSSQPVRAVA